jgi:Clp amino terminal domain, pathogenicity island component
MAEFPVPLDNLIAYVKALHPEGEPLDRVTDAFAVSARLDERSDALIGYFVDQARRSGASWSQIGGAMGVSKQAAQKRFVPGKLTDLSPEGAVFSRFTQRARNVLAAAGRMATPPADPVIGAAQMGAAEFAEPEGIAAKVIAKAGLTAERVYSALGAGPVTPGPDATADTLSELAFDESGKAVLKAALKAALRLGHNYIGTEHLLLGVLQAGGSAAEAFASLGLTLQTAQQLMADEFEEFQARRMTG